LDFWRERIFPRRSWRVTFSASAEFLTRFVTGRAVSGAGNISGMGRKRKNPDRAGVVVTLPRELLDRVRDVAALHRCDRGRAIERLLWRGLAATATKLETFDAVRRAALAGKYDHA
jgi:hypothetical protein